MKVLILGNSNDSGTWFEGGRKRTDIVRDRLAAEFGEPVTVTTKGIWPNAGMVATIERWLDEYEPDVVYMNVVSYWFAYESVPLKLRRLFGKRVGPVVGDAGVKLSKSRRWGHNVVGRTVRRWAQATIGGDPNFSTTEVVDRCSEAVNRIIRREGTVLVVKGSRGRSKPGMTARPAAGATRHGVSRCMRRSLRCAHRSTCAISGTRSRSGERNRRGQRARAWATASTRTQRATRSQRNSCTGSSARRGAST